MGAAADYGSSGADAAPGYVGFVFLQEGVEGFEVVEGLGGS
jgi:hypothetical protein